MISATASRAAPDLPAASRGFERLAGIKLALFSGNYNYLKEGANQALNKLVRHLEDRVGATVRVYSPTTDTPAFDPAGTLVPVRSIALPGRPEFRLALGLPRAIRDDVRAFAPDIVHVSTPDILCTRAQTFARTLGVPVVASLHTRFETYCDYYGLGWLRPLAERHLDRFYRRSDMTLLPTTAMMTDFGRRYGADKVGLWGRGVDSVLFDSACRSDVWRAQHGIGPEDVALAFFGRLVLEKNIDQFAQVVQTLRARGVPVRAVVIGEGPARAHMQGLLPDAVFTGHLTGAGLGAAIASCDLLLNPSLTETFGNVTLEAMAAGLTVVAADVESSTNLIVDGQNGLIRAPDPSAYVDAIEGLVADPAHRARIGPAARLTALERGWDDVLDGVLESYDAVLAASRGAGA